MAATERKQRRPSQVHTTPAQSSSVPSTPQQPPRDICFSSRSPSPGRGLSRVPTNDPSASRSRPFAEQAAQGICRFESGAEFRKRRIPYKDGGNDPLPPPRTAPKEALTPHEEDKLSGDMRELYDRLLPTDESEDRRSRLITKLDKMLNAEWPGNDIKVNVFGSSGNLLSSSDSDVDICITTTLQSLESMHGLATVLHQNGLERIVCRAAAKVPIVKAWDPELQLACDLNVNNTLALENTRMIKTYVQIDQRVRPLAKIIKYWTKQRILNDAAFGGTISSYTWICMVINFLQCRQPPILPSLQRRRDTFRSTVNGNQSQFADNLGELKGLGVDNKESLGSLLFQFFRFYGYEIDYSQAVISVKEGRVLSRKEKGWDPTNYQDKEARVRLCVEEPFNPNRNLGNSADDYAFSGIHEEIRRAFDLIAAGKLDECCAEYVFPKEEKTIFQRPAPRPKPTLTRSASQSGQSSRSHANSVGARGAQTARSSRASSSHRANNNRRASSGATVGNARYGFMSPTFSIGNQEYLGNVRAVPNEQLHEQLYQQYQFLQAQQELLRSQLIQQQQSHMQAHVQAQAQMPAQDGRGLDYSAPSPRQHSFATGGPSARGIDGSAHTAPLLPGYLYHYPARHPPPGTIISHTGLQEGTMTSPSSPSTAMFSSQRRSSQRGSIHDGTAPASLRSQSQPGRSFPSPVAIQSMAHPGYDVSGAINAQYLTQQQLQLMRQQQSSYDALAQRGLRSQQGFKTAIPKEYVGYYMGHSPQILPQGPIIVHQQVPVLQTIPLQERPPSPEMLPPILLNGTMRRRSRSPIDTGRQRSQSLSPSSKTKSALAPQLPFSKSAKQDQMMNGRMITTQLPGPPAIANGSGTSRADSAASNVDGGAVATQTNEQTQPVQVLGAKQALVATYSHEPHDQPVENQGTAHVPSPKTQGQNMVMGKTSPRNTSRPNGTYMAPSGLPASPSAGTASPNTRAGLPLLDLAMAQVSLGDDNAAVKSTTVTDGRNGARPKQQSPPHAAPLLSPVAEQTPSPKSSRSKGSPAQSRGTDANTSTIRAAAVAAIAEKNAQLTNGTLNERAIPARSNGLASVWSNPPSLLGAAPPLRPNFSSPIANGKAGNGKLQYLSQQTPPSMETTRPQQATPPSQNGQTQHQAASVPKPQGEWQQAVRKHKKGRSVGSLTANGGSLYGEVMPVRDSERKGG